MCDTDTVIAMLQSVITNTIIGKNTFKQPSYISDIYIYI